MMRTGLGHKRLLLLSLLIGLLGLEVAARAWYGPLPASLLDWSNQVVNGRLPGNRPETMVDDARLGWVGRPNFRSATINHDADGLRTTPARSGASPGPAATILALGDSFAYGAEVRDDETWPYYLQDLTDRRVVNAGAPGYGLDQTVLRAEQLAPQLKPRLLVVSFIPDDLIRNEMSRVWQREKPYFELQAGELQAGEMGAGALQLRNVPVPKNPEPASALPALERWMGWSVVLNTLRNHLVREHEIYFDDHVRGLPSGSGEKVACALMQRLARLELPVVVVAQYSPVDWKRLHDGKPAPNVSADVLDCARRAGLATLDLFEPLDHLIAAKGTAAAYPDRIEHHNAAGNRFVAERIAAQIGSMK